MMRHHSGQARTRAICSPSAALRLLRLLRLLRMRRAAAALVAVSVVAGCSSDGDSASTSPSVTAPAPSDSGATAPGSTAPATPTSGSGGASGVPTTSPTAGPVIVVGDPVDVVTDLDAPWSVVFVGATPLVSERDSGRILEVLPDGSTREVGSLDDVVHGGEGGLLGLAVDADDRLYAYSTGPNGNRIQRFPVTGEPGSYALGGGETLLDGIRAAGNHNGGRLAFGPDGMLYASVGDASERELAQDPSSLNGKILRMTPDGGVPPDNPVARLARLQLRAPERAGSRMGPDGTMFATEFGQNTWDELNVITAGANYGWPVVEGAAGDGRFVDPVQQWSTDVASPSGMIGIGGTLFIANLRGQVLRAVPVADPASSTEHFGELGRLRAVASAPDGSLWVGHQQHRRPRRSTTGRRPDRARRARARVSEAARAGAQCTVGRWAGAAKPSRATTSGIWSPGTGRAK